jgi:peptidoglycan/xylan/chitin deacetylase (PgdA/CDA1 family)
MPYWRAPFGEINKEILFWAAELGYRHIGWSSRCDSWDWVEDTTSNLYRSSLEIKKHFLQLEEKKGLKGKIILMHLASERLSDFPYENLPGLIDELRGRGYSFLKISQLLSVN